MSIIDAMNIDQLKRRVEAIEARQRYYGMHDPSCPARKTEIAQMNTWMYITPQDCDCWLVL